MDGYVMEMEFADFLAQAQALMKKGGPEPHEYEEISASCAYFNNKKLSVEEELKLHEVLKPMLNVDTMIGFSFQKPNGYAGDFELIDRIYQYWKSPANTFFHAWDNYSHDLDATKAVRNRKTYINKLLVNLQNRKKSPLVLNLGSGPCSDIHQFFTNNPKTKVHFDCLDMDSKAIDYGSAVCDNYIDSITFINKNAFRYKPDHQYDLIWSAGLFDYFNDKLFVRLLNRTYKLLSVDGMMAVGNFSDTNTAQGAMELLGQWYLHHRSKEHLVELAIKAGVPADKIEVHSEKTGVNLFLHLHK